MQALIKLELSDVNRANILPDKIQRQEAAGASRKSKTRSLRPIQECIVSRNGYKKFRVTGMQD